MKMKYMNVETNEER